MAATSTTSNNLALRAIGLVAAWRRATAAHMALSGGISCACGSAFDGLSSADLERDLLMYTYEKYRGADTLRPLFEKAGCIDNGDCDLASLVRAITEAPFIDQVATGHLLDDLEKAISGLSKN
ncbi:hypothetical protein [Candidimonas nitroreducens]|uniref:Uncharacterized protein n=1 Tax=Candidimonas nitroreducens TaxID=683354 RepID=A0A225M082_9BURK|nr:hypothetical protein [Candidimonas nitroreducens]OWT54807.1 hypothetical protein CEY11_21890 [Candidimonas nitroreducens]